MVQQIGVPFWPPSCGSLLEKHPKRDPILENYPMYIHTERPEQVVVEDAESDGSAGLAPSEGLPGSGL